MPGVLQVVVLRVLAHALAHAPVDARREELVAVVPGALCGVALGHVAQRPDARPNDGHLLNVHAQRRAHGHVALLPDEVLPPPVRLLVVPAAQVSERRYPVALDERHVHVVLGRGGGEGFARSSAALP